jgi:hypothetical protein
MTTTPIFNNREEGQAEAELFQLWLETQFLKQADEKENRKELHAANVIVPEEEWCTRRWVLNNTHSEKAIIPPAKPWDTKRENIFENGWAIHIKWQRFFKKLGIAVYNATLKGYELDLTHYDEVRDLYFSPDAIIMWAGQGYIVEIKGYNEEEYNKLLASPDVPELARKQCNFYLHLLGMKRGLVLVENKNKNGFMLWPVNYDQEDAQQYAQRAMKVKGLTSVAKAHGRYPERTCQSITDPLAQKCPLKTYCFSLT